MLSMEDAVSLAGAASVTVNAGATLELAGSKSALASANLRADINNNSINSLLVTGTNQAVGNIGGTGSTNVAVGANLNANHIRQSSLTIAGAAASATINPNGGNPGTSVVGGLDVSNGGVLDLTNNDLVIRATAVTNDAVHTAAQADIEARKTAWTPTWSPNGTARESRVQRPARPTSHKALT